MPPLALERDPRQPRGVSLLVRYFMIPCNVCLILLATSTLGFAVLLFLNNCRWLRARPPWAWLVRPSCWLSSPASAPTDWGAGRIAQRLPAERQLRWAPASSGDRMGHSLDPWAPRSLSLCSRGLTVTLSCRDNLLWELGRKGAADYTGSGALAGPGAEPI